MPTPKKEVRTRAPASSPLARENEMVSLAVDLAEKQLRDGSASSQVITHYLKLADTRRDKEIEKLELENQLLRTRNESIQRNDANTVDHQEVLAALRLYQGTADDEEYAANGF